MIIDLVCEFIWNFISKSWMIFWFNRETNAEPSMHCISILVFDFDFDTEWKSFAEWLMCDWMSAAFYMDSSNKMGRMVLCIRCMPTTYAQMVENPAYIPYIQTADFSCIVQNNRNVLDFFFSSFYFTMNNIEIDQTVQMWIQYVLLILGQKVNIFLLKWLTCEFDRLNLVDCWKLVTFCWLLPVYHFGDQKFRTLFSIQAISVYLIKGMIQREREKNCRCWQNQRSRCKIRKHPPIE